MRGQHHPSPPPETPTKKTQNSAAQSLTRRREDAKTQNKHHLPKTKNQSPPRPRRGRGVGGEGATPPQHPPETPTKKTRTQQRNASREDAKTRRRKTNTTYRKLKTNPPPRPPGCRFSRLSTYVCISISHVVLYTSENRSQPKPSKVTDTGKCQKNRSMVRTGRSHPPRETSSC